jgi:hypothetical protein
MLKFKTFVPVRNLYEPKRVYNNVWIREESVINYYETEVNGEKCLNMAFIENSFKYISPQNYYTLCKKDDPELYSVLIDKHNKK